MAKTPGMFRWIATPGLTRTEKEILCEVQVGVYERIESPIDKFIICFVYEAGNEMRDAARILGITESLLYKRIARVKRVLMPMVEKRSIASKIEV